MILYAAKTGSHEAKNTTVHFKKNNGLNKSIFISLGNINTHNTYTTKVDIIEASSHLEYLGTNMIIFRFSARTKAVNVIPTKLEK